jgi:hypothetical protein
MPKSAELGIYNGTKGDVNFQEVTTEFTGFPIMGQAVNERAKKILDWMNNTASNLNAVHRNSWNYNYEALGNDTIGLAQTKLTGGSLGSNNAAVTGATAGVRQTIEV